MAENSIFAGIDVGKKALHLAVRVDARLEEAVFDNDRTGHGKLARFLAKRSKRARVCLEATGPYSIDVSHFLHGKGFTVVIANPRATKAFAKASMQRAKTDTVDARMLADYAQAFPHREWKPRSKATDELVAICRHLDFVVRGAARKKNVRHASEATEVVPDIVHRWIASSLEADEKLIDEIEAEALRRMRKDPELAEHLEHLVAVEGIGERTAMHVIAWFSTLPYDLTADQVVAYAGLDPRPNESGARAPTSRSISRAGNARIRALLFMPALATTRCEGPLKAFYDRLVARGKKPRVAHVAVMRKMLTILWTLFQSRSAYEPARVGRRGPP